MNEARATTRNRMDGRVAVVTGAAIARHLSGQPPKAKLEETRRA